MTKDISQDLLIKKIEAYLNLVYGKDSFLNPRILPQGFCRGLSIVHGYMAVMGHLKWWHAALTALASWDNDPKNLQSVITIVGESEPKTRAYLFERIIHYIYFYQTGKLELALHFNPTKFFNPQGSFQNVFPYLEDIKGEVFFSQVFGRMDKEELKNFLIPECFLGESIAIIGSEIHACALRYESKKWFFYDPDNVQEKEFNDIDDLIKEIFLNLGHKISIEVAAWSSDADHKIALFDKKVYEFINKNKKSILQGGLENIYIRHPKQLRMLFQLAKSDLDFKQELKSVLKQKPENSSYSHEENILRLDTVTIFMLYDLFSDDQDHLKKIIEFFSKTSVFKSGFNYSVLQSLAFHHSNELNLFLTSTQHNKITEQSVVEAFSGKNFSNRAAFHQIAENNNAQLLFYLMNLAKKYPNLRSEIVSAFSIGWDKDIPFYDVFLEIKKEQEIVEKFLRLRDPGLGSHWRNKAAADVTVEDIIRHFEFEKSVKKKDFFFNKTGEATKKLLKDIGVNFKELTEDEKRKQLIEKIQQAREPIASVQLRK